MRKKKVLLAVCVAAVLFATLAGLAYAAYRKTGNPALREYHKIDLNGDGLHGKKELLAHKNKVVAEKHRQAIAIAKQSGRKENLVTVTFSRALSLEELEQLVKEYNVRVKFYEARAIDHQGTRVTIGLAPTKEKFLPEEFEQMLSDPQQTGAKMKCVGFIDLVGYLEVENLPRLQQDPRVFLVDNSADQAFIDNPKDKPMPSLYWHLEDLGLLQGEKYNFKDKPDAEIMKKITES